MTDKTARRAVDACGGTYTPAQEASGYADGHRDALNAAMTAVGCADALTAELLAVMQEMFCGAPLSVAFAGNPNAIADLEDRVFAAITKATGDQP